MTPRKRDPGTPFIPLIGIPYVGFILLGLPNGVLGVAWPAIRESFGLPLDALGTLLTTVTIGYILVSFSSGRLVSLTGLGPFLLLSSTVSAAGLLGYALAPTWWVMVPLGLLVGTGAGAMDAGMNMYVAANYGARQMNWLHASFGIGVTIGPAMMTALLNAGQSWRWGYAIIVLLQGLLAVCFGLTLDRWRGSGPASEAARPSEPSRTTGEEADQGPVSGTARSVDTLRLPLAWLGIAIFITHTGVQFTAGQWAYSLFTEARGVAPATAGLWTSVYWASLTAGRLLLGPVADRIGVVSLLRTCIVGIVLGSALVWWNLADLVSFLGLALIGFSLAPLFPSLISSTPERVGAGHAPNVIGFQVAAGSVGIALLPGFAGVLAQNLGLEIVGPFLVAASLLMFLLHEAIVRRAAIPRR
jgi:fucose permease